jgi:hypothetical protein
MSEQPQIFEDTDDLPIFSEESLNMFRRQIVAVALLTVAVSLSLGGRAHANYDVSTSIASISPGIGGSVVHINTPGPIVDGILGTIAAPAGYSQFTDSAGSTIYLVNDFNGNQAPGLIGTVNQALFVSTSVPDSGLWSFTETITVFNPNGQTTTSGTFTQTATYQMSVGGVPLTGSAIGQSTSLTPPTTILVGTTTFTISNPQANSQPINNSVNNAAVSANLVASTSIPEPASVVMLGAGLAGVIAFGVRRRSRLT